MAALEKEGVFSTFEKLHKQFLQGFGISRAFFPPVLNEEKCGKFQNLVEISHKAAYKAVAVVLICLSL